MEKKCVQLERRISSYLPSYLRLQLDHIPTTELLVAVREWIEVRNCNTCSDHLHIDL